MNYFIIKDKLNFEKKSKHKASEGNSCGKYPFFTSSPILNKNIDSFDYNGEYLIFGTGGSPSIHHYIGKFATSTDCLVYNTTSKEIDLKFIYYYIKSNSNILESGFHGAGLKHISSNYINNIKIPNLSLEKQKQIVSQFEKLEKLKEKRNQNIQRCDELIKSIFYDMFGDPTTNKKKWDIKKLEEVCNFVRGPFGGSLKKEIFKSSGYAVYEQQHAIYNQFNDIKYFIDENKFNEMKRFELNFGDLIMSCSGTMGKIAIVPKNAKKGIINQALLKITPSNNISIIFLKFLMQSKDFQDRLKIYSQGIAIQNVVSVKIIKQIKIQVPPITLQNEFANKVEIIEKLKEKQIKSKDEIDNLFNGLMQKYFNKDK